MFDEQDANTEEATQGTPGGTSATPAGESVAEQPPAGDDSAQQLVDVALGWLNLDQQAAWVQSLIVAGFFLALALVAYVIVRQYVLSLVNYLAKRSPTWWDNVIIEHKVFQRLVPIVPLFILHWGIVAVPHLPEGVETLVQRIALACMVIAGVRSMGSLLTAINAIYTRYPVSRGRPIKGYLQVVKIVLYITAGILIIATLMDRSPWLFLSGLGAMTAVILLIFRDTILSLVAGIQLVNNDLIRVGDWIEMPNFGADGDVVDIALNVVKVQNWDRTVTVIPAHKFLEHSFKNYRSMFEGGGRRVKRSILIDMSTIRFLSAEEIERFSRFLVLKEYMQKKSEEIGAYNKEHCPEEFADVMANARHLTNIGTFRAYISNYLQSRPYVHKNLIFLVRQLQPTPHGLPIEIYVFLNDTRWTVYEDIQADIFDHILAVISEFGLRIFQEPSGRDFARIAQRDSGTQSPNRPPVND